MTIIQQQNNEQKIKLGERIQKISCFKKEKQKKLISAFEKYKIKDVRTASAFEDEYDKVNAIIAKIPDEYAQGPYKERDCYQI